MQGTTGRFLVLLEENESKAAGRALYASAGIKSLSVGGTDDAPLAEADLSEDEAIVFHDLGVAVVNAAPDTIAAVSAAVATTSSLQIMEPERYVYAIADDLAYIPRLSRCDQSRL
jgi:hypothetical protein